VETLLRQKVCKSNHKLLITKKLYKEIDGELTEDGS
jgi:hypothetical protein